MNIKTFILWVIIIIQSTYILLIPHILRRNSDIKIDTIYFEPEQLQLDDWEIFRTALITVESECNHLAENKHTGAFGLYQILPKGGYLCEYNRINGSNLTINDLHDINTQHDVFDAVQVKYNPNKDIRKALFIHNSRAMNENYMTHDTLRI